MIAAIAGLFGFVFVFLWLDEHLPRWIAIPLVSIGYAVILAQGMRLVDYLRKRMVDDGRYPPDIIG
jgi:hypothetical protein